MTARCWKCEVAANHPHHDQGTPNLPVDPSLLLREWRDYWQIVAAVEAQLQAADRVTAIGLEAGLDD